MSLDVRGLVLVGAACFDLPDGSSFAVRATEHLEPAERTVGLPVDDLDATSRSAGLVDSTAAAGAPVRRRRRR